MSFSWRPIGDIVRGPLIDSPQGRVVIVVAVIYVILIGWIGLDMGLPFGKSKDGSIAICILWPIVTFLYFLREGLSTTPEFKPSVLGTIWILIVGFAPFLLMIRPA